jgi:CubicO group peptidase (beta-lactamase class C family)
MSHTRISLDPTMRAKLAPGHDWVGQGAGNWDFDALAGAGGVRSTVDDMLLFLAAHLEPPSTPLGSAMKTTHEPRVRVDDRTDIGLGWHVARRTKTRYHNGGTGGYSSYAAFVPDHHIAVVVLSSSANPIVDKLGIQLVKAELGEKVEPITPSTRTTSWPSPTP